MLACYVGVLPPLDSDLTNGEWFSLGNSGLRDFRVERIVIHQVIVVIQLSRACGTPSLRSFVHSASFDGINFPLGRVW
ncbi:hypothetical protein [Rubritalea tangerina]|uniref:hypothetical protein n=1 Tax=Rubritalea tangerina TaxID=430798 RepID=UPI0036222707